MLHRTTEKINGFTVVELMVVIIIIGIIATIGTVSFNHVLVSARNTDRLAELKAWEHSFNLYAKFEKAYPSVPADNQGYCLGTGFPSDNCGRLSGGSPSERYSIDEDLNTALIKIAGKDPSSEESKNEQYNRWPVAIGPYAYFASGTVTLSNIFEGTTCPNGTELTQTYTSGKRVVCSIELPHKYYY